MMVTILTEGSSEKGFGHLTRCQALAETCQEEGMACMMYVDGPSRIHAVVPKRLARRGDWITGVRLRRTALTGTDCVIIDSYHASHVVYREIAKQVPLLVCIDDYDRIKYPTSSVVLKVEWHAKSSYRPFYILRRPHEPTYWYELLLRKEFAQRTRRHIRNKITNVLITIGATDLRSLTPNVLQALSANYPRWKKHVVVGAGFRKQNRQQLLSLQKKDRTVQLHNNLSAAALIKLMYTADIAISGAGQTLNELACVGLPAIGVIVAENQILNARAWQRHNVIHPIDVHTGASANFASQLIHACRNLDNVSRRKEMSRAGRRLIDGSGARRIAREIKHTLHTFYDR